MSCCSDVMKPIKASSCCTPKDTVAQASQAMRDSGCGCTPVVEDTEKLKLVGVVTERDVCCGVAAEDLRASEVRVEKSCDPCRRVAVRASRLKKRAGNCTSIAPRACPLQTRRAVAAAQSAFTVWGGRRAPHDSIDEFDEPFEKAMATLAQSSPQHLDREQ